VQYVLPEKSETAIRMFDVMGKLVWQQTVPEATTQSGWNNLRLDLGNSPTPGVYFLTFSAGSFEKTIKLVKTGG
jgi:hypothetical protein